MGGWANQGPTMGRRHYLGVIAVDAGFRAFVSPDSRPRQCRFTRPDENRLTHLRPDRA